MGSTQLGEQDRYFWMAEQLYHYGHNFWIHSWLYAHCSHKEDQSEIKRAGCVRHLVLFCDERFNKWLKDVRMPWTQILKNMSGKPSHMRKRIDCFFSGKSGCSTCSLNGMPSLRLSMKKAFMTWHLRWEPLSRQANRKGYRKDGPKCIDL